MTCPHGKKGSGHTMKAWNCADHECGFIVFAETRAKARTLAMGEAGFECSEWVEIEVRRMKELDGLRDEPCVLDWQENERVYYEAGWFPEECAPFCIRCERYQYERIPESFITWTEHDGDMCVACKNSKPRVNVPHTSGASDPGAGPHSEGDNNASV